MVVLDFADRRLRHPEKAHRPDSPVSQKPDWIRVKAPGSPGYAETRIQSGFCDTGESGRCAFSGWRRRRSAESSTTIPCYLLALPKPSPEDGWADRKRPSPSALLFRFAGNSESPLDGAAERSG